MSATEIQQTSQAESQLRESVKHLAHDSAELLRQTGNAAKGTLKKPTTGAAIAGAAAMGAIFAFGFLPTAVAGAAGYLSYRMLRKRRTEEAVT